MTKLVEILTIFVEKYYDFKCTRRTQQINTESKNTEISIFDTKESDKWSQKST